VFHILYGVAGSASLTISKKELKAHLFKLEVTRFEPLPSDVEKRDISIQQIERLTRVPRVREVESLNPNGRPNLRQRCKQFATVLTSTKVAVLPWRYNAEMGPANSLHASA